MDDSPAELAEVKAAHPEIECLQFPADPQEVYNLVITSAQPICQGAAPRKKTPSGSPVFAALGIMFAPNPMDLAHASE